MKISIVMPVFNREHTLARCIASVQAQTIEDWELIAVDDGSSDDSIGAVLASGDPRIRLLRHAVNRGPSAARNTGLAATRGEYVALIDSDDEWLPEKLERQLAFLAEHALDGCGCEYWQIDEQGRATNRTLPSPESWRDDLHTRCEFTGSTLLTRRACVEAVGEMAEELRLYEDWDWMIRFVAKFRYGIVRAPLARYYSSGPRRPVAVAQNAERFLWRNEAEFRRLGLRHWCEVRSEHYEFVASNALAQRQYALGCKYLWRSVVAAPWRKPQQLAALPLALLDALAGTAFLHRAAGWPNEAARP